MSKNRKGGVNMTAQLPTGRIEYAESRVVFFKTEAERWLKEHHAAQACMDHEEFIRDVNVLLDDIFKLDRRLESVYCDGLPYDEDLNTRVLALFDHWYQLARNIHDTAAGFEQDGYDVDGLSKLREGIVEVGALLDPSDVVDGQIAQLRDAALAANAIGDVAEGLVD
jgi:hypothetical protein